MRCVADRASSTGICSPCPLTVRRIYPFCAICVRALSETSVGTVTMTTLVTDVSARRRFCRRCSGPVNHIRRCRHTGSAPARVTPCTSAHVVPSAVTGRRSGRGVGIAGTSVMPECRRVACANRAAAGQPRSSVSALPWISRSRCCRNSWSSSGPLGAETTGPAARERPAGWRATASSAAVQCLPWL